MTRKTNSWKQLLEYMMRDKSRTESFILKQHIEGKTIKEWSSAFEKNERNRLHRRANNVKLYHEILSWSTKDIQKLTDAKMKDMAQKYMELRNENALAIAIPHFNKTHYHIHICFSGVEVETGKSTRISKGEFNAIKERIQEYQMAKYPELSSSIVDHNSNGKTQKKDREFQLTKRTKGLSEKERTQQLLAECYKKSLSQTDFFKRVTQAGLNIYERNGKVTGVEGDRRMRFSSLGFGEAKMRDLENRATRLEEIEGLRNEDRYDRAKDLEERFSDSPMQQLDEEDKLEEGVEKEKEVVDTPSDDSRDLDFSEL